MRAAILFAQPKLNSQLIDLLVWCDRRPVREHCARQLWLLCRVAELTSRESSASAPSSRRPLRDNLLKILLTAQLPFWSTTLVLRKPSMVSYALATLNSSPVQRSSPCTFLLLFALATEHESSFFAQAMNMKARSMSFATGCHWK